jgi:hypothetical protein
MSHQETDPETRQNHLENGTKPAQPKGETYDEMFARLSAVALLLDSEALTECACGFLYNPKTSIEGDVCPHCGQDNKDSNTNFICPYQTGECEHPHECPDCSGDA